MYCDFVTEKGVFECYNFYAAKKGKNDIFRGKIRLSEVMNTVINGLAKLTLLDYPGKTAATVFLAGCNMRCPFCHNAPLVIDAEGAERISEDTLRAFLARRAGLLDGICITGGEPTLRPDIFELSSLIKSYGYSLKLDTNGTHPERLERLIDKNLVDYVAMDIKNSPERYAETVGIENFNIAPVLASVELLKSGKIDYEFRTTAVGGLHTVESFDSIGRLLGDVPRYFIQNFVDSGALLNPDTVGCTPEQMKAFLEAVRPHTPHAELRGI